MLALLLTAGAVTVLLFVIWLTGKVVAPARVGVPVDRIDVAREGGEDGGNRLAPGGSQLETPSNEPGFRNDNKAPDIQDELNRLDVAAVNQKAGSIGTGDGDYGGTGSGEGLGDRRGRRPGAPLPPAKTWEVLFSKSTLDAYARQLDFFKIELGVLLPDNKIIYAHNLTKSKPDTRTVANPAASENRYYLTWRSGEMQQADRELFSRAGVEVGDSLVVKFLPQEVEQRLIELEKTYAGGDAKRIRKTRFGVRAEGGGFEFFVLEQSLKR